METYYAKSSCADGHKPTVKEHLEAVSDCAAQYGNEVGIENEARLAGMLHDFGKYSESFQKVLMGENHNIDHAMCGTAWLFYNLQKKTKKYGKFIPIFETVTGHHDGLQNHRRIENAFIENYEGTCIPVNGNKEPALHETKDYEFAAKEWRKEFKLDLKSISKFDVGNGGLAELEIMLHTRMIFSCLVDADYSISAKDNNPNYFKESEGKRLDAESLLQKLYAYMEKIKKESQSNVALNEMRNIVFEKCGTMGTKNERIFTLTAPTGLGKTLAMLHFALMHCKEYKKERIIIVLPFLTLAEQNASTYAKIVTELLIDHSQSDLRDAQKEFSARWRYPFIITTSVKFFETLFAKKPTECRKLHNIANSVVLFDEVQSLPSELIGCTLHAVKQLCEKYNTTMVFSSATQPEFSEMPYVKEIGWKSVEILPDYVEYYQKMQRTNVEWRLDKRISLESLAMEIYEKKSVCVIVNLRKHARKLFEELKNYCSEDEIFFLTTDMCPLHRSHIVQQIRKRLESKLVCRVISTQCIEAGIDLDFEEVYRSLAPLDSIIQAAGRCNRNGTMLDKGRVIIFEPDEEGKMYPGIWYENASKTVKEMLAEFVIDINNPDHISVYYQRILRRNRDKKALVDAIKDHAYEKVEQEYRLIDAYGYKIIVPYDAKSKMLIEKMNHEGVSPKILQEVSPYMVTVSISGDAEIEDYAEQVYYQSRRGKVREKSEWYILRSGNEKFYKKDMGLQLPEKIIFNAFW